MEVIGLFPEMHVRVETSTGRRTERRPRCDHGAEGSTGDVGQVNVHILKCGQSSNPQPLQSLRRR